MNELNPNINIIRAYKEKMQDFKTKQTQLIECEEVISDSKESL